MAFFVWKEDEAYGGLRLLTTFHLLVPALSDNGFYGVERTGGGGDKVPGIRPLGLRD